LRTWQICRWYTGQFTIAEIKQRVADRAEDIAARLLTDARRDGAELIGYGRDGSKFKVHLIGRKRGMVLDTVTPNGRGEQRRGGSLLNLVTYQLGNGDLQAGLRASLALLGLADDAAPIARTSAADRARERSERARAAELDIARRRAKAWEIWQGGVPIAPDAPAWLYLAGRSCARGSRALRSGRCWHGDAKAEFDAMIAAVIDPASGRFRGVHVTYLASDAGAWHKAQLATAKRTLGPIGGGVVPLAAGTDELLLGEGIENTLTAARLAPGLTCWAGLSIGNLAQIALPARFRVVRLVRGRDGDKAQLRELRERMVARWQAEQRAVRPIDPPAGFKDINDWAQSMAPELAKAGL
jgi:hypothetical protein